MEKVRRTAVVYLFAQAIAVAAWWTVLLIRPETRSVFQLENASDTSLMAFLPPDAAFMVLGSLIAAYLVYSRNRFEIAGLWLLAGAIAYAFAYTFSHVLATDRGWVGVVKCWLPRRVRNSPP